MGDTYRLGPKHGCVLVLVIGLVKLIAALSGLTAGGVLAYIIVTDLTWLW